MTDPLVGETQERFIRFGTNHAEAAREAVLSLVREHHVVLEACPRSNMVLSGLRGIDEHPIWEWLRADLEVSVSSDDPLVFGSTVTDEFKALASCDIDVNLVNAAAVISTKACSNGDRRRLKDISALRRALGSS
jgi:adenosine deaminase